MSTKPFGYRSPDYAERCFGITTLCKACAHSEPPGSPNKRHRCFLTHPSRAVGKDKTCSAAKAKTNEKVKP